MKGAFAWVIRPTLLPSLSARLLDADERVAKAAIYGLNHVSRQTHELEEAWIVQALVREDGLSQVEAAELLGRHKSWVCRRLALLEKLSAEVRSDLEVGVLPPSLARHIEPRKDHRASAVRRLAAGPHPPELRHQHAEHR